MALVLSYDTTDSTKQNPSASTRSYYQSFSPTATFTLTGIEINIDSIVSGTARTTVYFYNADGEGKPSGAALSGGSVGSIITTDTGWQGNLTLSGSIELSSGSSYCFRLQGVVTSGTFYFDFDSNDGYANGTAWYWNGSSYEAQSGDINFKLYGTLSGPSKATSPTPSDASTTVTLGQQTIEWEDGGGATSYDVYYGETGSLSLVSEGQADTSFTISGITLGSPFDYETTRSWRIDAINNDGTTTGDTWSFTTITFSPPVAGASGGGGSGSGFGGENNIQTIRRIVVASNNKIWYENI